MIDLKQKLRRSAAYLQGCDTKYFSDSAKLEAIRTLYRIADGLEGVPNDMQEVQSSNG